MCILFLYVADKPTSDSFKFILAVNRDELYKRPTRPAKFWGTTPDIVGGVDLEPGREGGTWLGISKTGKIGSLLNVLQSRASLANSSDKRGRGFLVNDFLKTPTTGMEYLTELFQISSEYNPFNIVTIEGLLETPRVTYYSCAENREPRELPAGTVHGVGNSYINIPFRKVKTGREALEKVIRERNHEKTREELIEGILGVLRNEEQYHPDPQIYEQAPDQPESFLRGISSRFIKLSGYGTRTHTIILVDSRNRVYFQEMTLQEPINETNPTWTTSSYNFLLEKGT